MSLFKKFVVFTLVASFVMGVFFWMAADLDALGYPTDDSWIHQVYARNLAHDGEWAFVSGEASVGSTSPFYVILLAIGRLMGISHFVWVYLLGVAALVMGGVSGATLIRWLYPTLRHADTAMGLAVILSWNLVWAAASGMETMLFTALVLLTFAIGFYEATPAQKHVAIWKIRRGMLLGATAGLLTLTRPEGILVVGLVGIFGLLTTENKRLFFIWAVSGAVVWTGLVAPYLAWNYHVIGEILPSTAQAKLTQHSYLREQSILTRYLNMTLVMLLGAQLIVMPASVYGLWQTTQKIHKKWLLLAPAVWAFAHLTLYVIQLPSPNQNGRYVLPILPILWLYGIGGLGILLQKGQATPLGRVLSRTYTLSTALLLIGFLWFGGQNYAHQVRAMNTEMVAASQWVKENVPSDDVFAVHDIGALGYFAPRQIVDIAGLVNPEVIPFIEDGEKMMAYICQQKARWLMALPDQRPVEADDPRITLVYESDTTYLNDQIQNNDTGELWKMRVYRLNCP